MRALTPGDVNMVVRRLPSDVRTLMRKERIFLAGGFIREVISGQPVQDIDLFGQTKAQLNVCADWLQTERGNAGQQFRVHTTKFATTVLCPPRAPVQFISKWLYEDPAQLVAELDFTVCQAALWYEHGQYVSVCADDFYSDLAARRLVYTFPVRAEAAGGSLMRVRKFLARGYNIQASSLAGVVARLMGGINDGKLTGLISEGRTVEQARHLVLKALLHEVDPLLVVDGVEPREEEIE